MNVISPTNSLSAVIWIVIVTSENLRQLFPLNLILAILLTICMSLESGVLGICLNFWWKITVWIVAMVLFFNNHNYKCYHDN
ncbi:hypothetical protein KSF78_0004456 [Schistosoma japonicum]|nr:hypothetical protein KSF78_0004456 [Schistosoma japonicum]